MTGEMGADAREPGTMYGGGAFGISSTANRRNCGSRRVKSRYERTRPTRKSICSRGVSVSH